MYQRLAASTVPAASAGLPKGQSELKMHQLHGEYEWYGSAA
uniref:Uncharacterized protein n=1 Tax=Faecalibaculum rodentium TaxID=1702221 RepID=A0A140DRR1_9FIRM|nr:hypothetical protein AALO17_02040 [Faecalibaculum rodentium]